MVIFEGFHLIQSYTRIYLSLVISMILFGTLLNPSSISIFESKNIYVTVLILLFKVTNLVVVFVFFTSKFRYQSYPEAITS